jgi:hypothetical protein
VALQVALTLDTCPYHGIAGRASWPLYAVIRDACCRLFLAMGRAKICMCYVLRASCKRYIAHSYLLIHLGRVGACTLDCKGRIVPTVSWTPGTRTAVLYFQKWVLFFYVIRGLYTRPIVFVPWSIWQSFVKRIGNITLETDCMIFITRVVKKNLLWNNLAYYAIIFLVLLSKANKLVWEACIWVGNWVGVSRIQRTLLSFGLQSSTYSWGVGRHS